MSMVRTNKEFTHEHMEVLSCRSRLPRHYDCEREIERNWRPWYANARWPSVWSSVPRSSCTVPMGCLTGRSNANCTLRSIRCSVGAAAMSRKASTVCRIARVPADRRLFPPQQQHEIVALATRPPRQEGHPITHWSLGDLTRAVVQKGIADSIGVSTIWRLLDQAAIKPHRWHYWLHSPDPDFSSKMKDIVELYLNALRLYERGEIVLSVDEKTSIQALGRRYPHKPLRPGGRELIEHEYKRHGTCCLTAGLEVATGQVMGLLTPNRPAQVFAEFIEWACQTYAEARRIHVVLDNLNTHYHELTCQVVADFCHCRLGPTQTGLQRKEFLTDPSKRVVFHFTPSHASWLNQIEIWFSTLARKVLRRGDFRSVDDLQDKIIAFIEYYDACLAKPYQWTYTGKPLAAGKKAA